MIKRHGLVLFLFCCSITAGILITIPGAVALFFFAAGATVLLITVSVLFATAVVLWLTLGRKIHSRKADRSIINQGTAFGVWFAGHNLAWALAGSLSIWGLVSLFGPVYWVMIFSAAALACIFFALFGILIARGRRMLGLCWQSPVPDGLADFWSRAGAAVILRERYEYAAENDQRKHTPVLWSIARVFDRTAAGGAHRKVELMNASPGFLSAKLKKEWLHRFKVLFILFWLTAALAALPGLLGITSHNWNQVPDGWPSAKIKKRAEKKEPAPEKPQLMASKSEPAAETREENRAEHKRSDSKEFHQNRKSDRDNETGRDRENRSKASGDTGQSGQEHSDPGQYDSDRGREEKESGKESRRKGSGPGQGDRNTDRGRDGKDGRVGDGGQESGGPGQGDAGQDRKGEEHEGGRGEKRTEETGQKDSGQDREGKENGTECGGQGQKQKGEGDGERSRGQRTGDHGQKVSGQGQKGEGSEGENSGQGKKGKEEGSGSKSGSEGREGKQGGAEGGGQKAGESKSGQDGSGQGQEGKESSCEGGGQGAGGSGQGKQGQQGSQQSQSEGSGQGAGKSGQSDPGQGQKGRGEGSGGESQEGGAANQGDAEGGQVSEGGASGGSGRGSGSPDDVPDTFAEPGTEIDAETVSEPPSRTADMVTIELPTLTPRPGKGESKKKIVREPKKGSPAPTTRFKTGEQERRASKPEQFLPNWILMLLKEKKHR